MIRPAQVINEQLKDYKSLTKDISFLYKAKYDKTMLTNEVWEVSDSDCFLPFQLWQLLYKNSKSINLSETIDTFLLFKFASYVTWKYSQGYYAFNDALANELLSTPLEDSFPAELLTRLPEWCVYITKGNGYLFEKSEDSNSLYYGIFVSIQYHTEFGKCLLITFDCDIDLRSLMLPLDTTSITEMAEKHVERTYGPLRDYKDMCDAIKFLLAKILPLILYLCSAEPDIQDDRGMPYSGQRNQPKRVKGGVKIFPAEKPRLFKVGEYLGHQISSAMQSGSSSAKKQPHLRRAHWHGYWTGPGRTKFVFKWIPPIFVDSRNSQDSYKGDVE